MAILRETITWRRAKRGRCQSSLTAQEREHLANVVRLLRVRHGNAKKLAALLGCSERTVEMATTWRRTGSADLAVRVARLLGVCVTAIISGGWPRVGECPYCRHVRRERSRAKVQHA